MLRIKRLGMVIILSALFLSGCYQPGPGAEPWRAALGAEEDVYITPPAQLTSDGLQTLPTVVLTVTPTPNPPITLPTLRSETLQYAVQEGDTLAKIAQRFQVTVTRLISVNEIINPNLIDVGQVLLIPPPSFDDAASGFKIIPDSELINSPSNAAFDVDAFVAAQDGYLSSYKEEVEGVTLSGAEIVKRVALENSVNPRLLLTLLEYQSGWVTAKRPAEETLIYPMRFYEALREGLYKQLGYAANFLNEGYYLWKINAIAIWTLRDDSMIQVEPTINAGTAGVLNLLRYLYDKPAWDRAVSDGGVFALYHYFFGYPFDFAIEPLIPDNLAQPELQLPFEEGDIWSFTGGPHGGWNSGSAWAALDFAPPGDAMGCFPSSAWVVASAPGEIVYSDHGAVIQDLDGDGIWQTGWSIFYMHIDSWERVEAGTYLEAGERVGHPSCEGGYSSGTHLHIARRYNGEWIAADGDLPLVLDGWVSSGYGVEYNGYLTKGDVILEAWNGRSPYNAIQR